MCAGDLYCEVPGEYGRTNHPRMQILHAPAPFSLPVTHKPARIGAAATTTTGASTVGYQEKHGSGVTLSWKGCPIPNTTGNVLTRDALKYIVARLPNVISAKGRKKLESDRTAPPASDCSMLKGFLATQQLLTQSHEAMDRAVTYMESSKYLFRKATDTFKALVLEHPGMALVREQAVSTLAAQEKMESKKRNYTASEIEALAKDPAVTGDSEENSIDGDVAPEKGDDVIPDEDEEDLEENEEEEDDATDGGGSDYNPAAE